jgi:hypothetical protein
MRERNPALEQAVLTLEEEGWRALSSDAGADYYRTHLTDDALMVFPFGVLTREQSIEAIEAAPPWASYRIDEPRVVLLTEDSALVTYRATARREGDPTGYRAWITSVFVNRDGTWKLALHQQSPVVEAVRG